MNGSRSSGALERGFDICGVPVAVAAPDEEILDRIVALLPAGIQPLDPMKAERRFAVVAVEAGWKIEAKDTRAIIFPDLEIVIQMLDGYLRRYVASKAPGRVFVHAGAVAHRGLAIVIPGEAFSGKSTLVAALIRAGAVYYSDEYAVLDTNGLVHPYARPLSIRGPDPDVAARPTAESLGGVSGDEPLPIGLIAATTYRPGADFRPRRESAAKGVLALVAHSMPARAHPAETMAAARQAASTALVLEGERGEADAAAAELLKLADELAGNGSGPRSGSAVTNLPGPSPEHVVAYEVYGTRASVSVPDPELVPPVEERLPLHSTRCEPGPDDRRFALEVHGTGFLVVEDGEVTERPPTLDGALEMLRRRLFYHAVDHARTRLVVAAGVVAHEGRAIVLPGPAAHGKSRLVAALVRAGAVYYADDWAILDPDGRVHPFPTRLFLRAEGKVTAESLGGSTGERPIPVGVIATVAYRPEARWSVEEQTAGDGVMTLMGHAYGLDAPDVAMEAARNAAAGALVLSGERGEADEAAAALLDAASQHASQVDGGSA